MQGDQEQAAPWLDESVAIWREQQKDRGLTFALLGRGVVALSQGDFTAVHSFLPKPCSYSSR